MERSVVKRVKNLFVSGQSAETGRGTKPDGDPSTLLYACSECGTTYISEGMQSCPECDTAVSRIPSERDLGFGPAGD